MPDFAEFERKLARTPGVPFVTLTERGVISFSVPAYELLGSSQAVKLLYDDAEGIVGFKAAAPDDENAYTFRRSGTTTRSLSAARFCRHVGIRETRRWPVYLEDGIVCADLKQPGSLVTSNRAGSGSGT